MFERTPLPSQGTMGDRSSKYRKLSPLEHITTRPGMYLGDTSVATAKVWLASVSEATVSLRSAQVDFVPALFKLFDEVVSNALDASVKDPTVKNVWVALTERAVSVRNDGAGIPVEVHAESGLRVPQLIFGELHAGDNFGDEERLVAGQNGLGVKLCNIFSSSFTVKVRDSQTGSVWECTWSNGMTKMGVPKLKLKDKAATGFVDVLFEPLPMMLQPSGTISQDVQSLFARRALDVALAARHGVRVSINDVKLPEMTLKRYAQLFVGGDAFLAVDEQPGWRVALASTDSPFVVGLVNGVSALGVHVDYVERRLYAALAEALKSKRDFKGVELKPASFRSKFALFVVASVSQPSFDSQTKERCVSFDAKGSLTYTPSDAFVKKIAGSEALVALAEAERSKGDKRAAAKTDGRMTSTVRVPKLVDALWAGTAKSSQCSLILTEGDSARTFAIAGLDALGRERYGVWPLKGKPINARDASAKQLADNEEVTHLKTILALRSGEAHAGGAGLRYGSVLVLTDSDADGSHIRGLVLNLLHSKWPALARSGFVKVLQTPIVRAYKGTSTKDFVNLSQLNAWAATGEARGWRMKYFKGLGTWNNSDAKKLLALARPVAFVDGSGTDEAMELAFDAKMANARKDWILANVAQPPVPNYTENMTIERFVNTDLVNYCIYSVERALPSVLDGLKTSQRKILYTVLKRGYLTQAKEIKVAQLAGDVAHATLYLHGEASLCGAITNMAQDFCGSNNLNLLVPNGAFGSRLGNGSDSASPRYIYTYAHELARALCSPLDDPLLPLKQEEGTDVEPAAFWPVLPLVLINGSNAIATGFSTSIPMFNPKDVYANVLRALDGQPPQVMVPWFRGFSGLVEPSEEGKWRVQGVATLEGEVWTISELPPGLSFTKYSEWLASEKSPVTLLADKCNETRAQFTVRFSGEQPRDVLAALKLVDTVSARNMYLFDAAGGVKKYSSAEEILVEWCAWRLARYEDRRLHVAEAMEAQAATLRNKRRFVGAVVAKKLVVQDYSELELAAVLETKGFDKVRDSYDYLLSIPARSFTRDHVERFERECELATQKAQQARCTTAEALWRADLAALASGDNVFV